MKSICKSIVNDSKSIKNKIRLFKLITFASIFFIASCSAPINITSNDGEQSEVEQISLRDAINNFISVEGEKNLKLAKNLSKLNIDEGIAVSIIDSVSEQGHSGVEIGFKGNIGYAIYCYSTEDAEGISKKVKFINNKKDIVITGGKQYQEKFDIQQTFDGKLLEKLSYVETTTETIGSVACAVEIYTFENDKQLNFYFKDDELIMIRQVFQDKEREILIKICSPEVFEQIYSESFND